MVLERDPLPRIPGSPVLVAPYLHSIAEKRGAFGISHGRAPTETRPAHVTLLCEPGKILNVLKLSHSSCY
jgi:GPI ethanolamine phosphate transferase 1